MAEYTIDYTKTYSTPIEILVGDTIVFSKTPVNTYVNNMTTMTRYPIDVNYSNQTQTVSPGRVVSKDPYQANIFAPYNEGTTYAPDFSCLIDTDVVNELWFGLADRIGLYLMQFKESGVPTDASKSRALRNTKTVYVTLPASYVPTITSAALQESTATQGYATQFGTFIQNRSILATKISAQASLGTKISRVELFAGANTSGTFLGGGDITPVETLTDYIIAETSPITATSGQRTIRVTDMRGRTTTQTVSFTALAYTPPTLTNVTLQRTDNTGAAQNTGTYMRYAITGNIQSLKPNGTTEKNTKALTLRWRVAGSTGWSMATPTVSFGAINLNAFLGTSHVFSDSISYEFEVILTDFFGSVTRSASLPKAFVLLDMYKNGTAVGVGKFATGSDRLDIGLDTNIDEKLTVSGGAQIDGGLTLGTPLPKASGGLGADVRTQNALLQKLGIQRAVTVVPSVPGGGGKTVTVSFSTTFATVPKAIITNVKAVSTSVNGYFSYASDYTQTGFSLSVVRSGGSGSADVSVAWIAIL